MKQKTNREKQNEQQRGKKRFMERLVETQEAEREIKQYDRGEPIEQYEHPQSKKQS